MKEYEFSPFEYNWEWDDTKKVMRVTKREPTAKEWVEDMHKRYREDPAAIGFFHNQWTYVVDDHGNVGKACLSPKDSHDPVIGVTIAYARLRGFPIHSAFKPQTAPKYKLLTLRGSRYVKKDARVWDKTNKKWGTVIENSTAACTYLKVRWDECHYDCIVPKNTVLLAITGES